jgi:hypothetical protein
MTATTQYKSVMCLYCPTVNWRHGVLVFGDYRHYRVKWRQHLPIRNCFVFSFVCSSLLSFRLPFESYRCCAMSLCCGSRTLSVFRRFPLQISAHILAVMTRFCDILPSISLIKSRPTHFMSLPIECSPTTLHWTLLVLSYLQPPPSALQL